MPKQNEILKILFDCGVTSGKVTNYGGDEVVTASFTGTKQEGLCIHDAIATKLPHVKISMRYQKLDFTAGVGNRYSFDIEVHEPRPEEPDEEQ